VTTSHLTRRRLLESLGVLAALLVASIGACVALGPVDVDWSGLLTAGDRSATDQTIVFSTRLPRVLLGAVVGAALGCSGAALQGLLANPLADPHLLGVSAGAAVAGALALLLGADPVSPLVPLAAFAGALLTVATVYRTARADGRTTPHAILLIGVVCNALAASVIMLVNAVAGYAQPG
jgi:iron complex transport system permease protein